MAILSIQSHVAYGHVGNAAAVFPLQRLGFEVWPVHTLQLSNHRGYPTCGGDTFPASQVAAVLDGIGKLGVLGRCRAVLSGYLGEAALGAAVLDAVAQVKAANPGALYCCDPVMGDSKPGAAAGAAGALYVKPEIPRFFAERALPAADILTPNLFELATLSGRRIETRDGALAAAQALIARGPKIVLVTSVRTAEVPDGSIEMLAVTAESAWKVATPYLEFDIAPNGAGDAVAALFLAHLLKGEEPGRALGAAAASLHGVMAATRKAGGRELALIEAQDEIVRPSKHFAVERISGKLDIIEPSPASRPPRDKKPRNP